MNMEQRNKLLWQLLQEIEAAMSDRYDGAEDSSNRWMGEYLSQIEMLRPLQEGKP